MGRTDGSPHSLIHPSPLSCVTHRTGMRSTVDCMPHAHSAAIGLYFATGSAHESDGQRGITHLLEHMVFKGTTRRTARDISVEMESLGGYLNGETAVDYTAFFAHVQPQHVDLALDVLFDMISDPLLAQADLRRERQVVLEEIADVRDDPGERVVELTAQAVWGQHPLARPVHGLKTELRKATPDQLRQALQSRFCADTLVVAAAGPIDADTFHKRIEAVQDGVSARSAQPYIPPPTPQLRVCTSRMDRDQVSFGFAWPTDGHLSPARYITAFVNVLLAGCMSSRLVQLLRETHGLVYNITSSHVLCDTAGYLSLQGSTSPALYEQVSGLIRHEITHMLNAGFTSQEIELARSQLIAAVRFSMDNVMTRMYRAARHLMVYGAPADYAAELDMLQTVSCGAVNAALPGLLDSTPARVIVGPSVKCKETHPS